MSESTKDPMSATLRYQDQRPLTMTLRDGRTFAWYEFGDPAGLPCLSSSGTPTSGLLGLAWDEQARAAGVRWISVDKPGYGLSSFDPKRSLARYVDDIRELLDHLGLDRVVALGESGGGPHTYVLAHDLADRVRKAIVLSGLGPGSEAWVREGMMAMNRRMLLVARVAPWALRVPMALTRRLAFNPDNPAGFVTFMAKFAPESDKAFLARNPELVRLLSASGAEALRNGSRSGAQEFAMFAQPWHFRLEDITIPVDIWHGSEDVNVPVATAQEMHRRIPSSTLHIVEGGHMACLDHMEEILRGVIEGAAAS